MKMATQHRDVKISVGGKKPQTYRAHRDYSSVWLTGGEKGATIFSHQYDYVSEAKKWMNHPKMSA